MLAVDRSVLHSNNTIRRQLLALRAQWCAKFARDPLERDVSDILHRALTARRRPGVARLGGFSIAYRDAWTLYIESLYVWYKQIYRFPFDKPALIIDGGASGGVSSLYFRKQFPSARIVAFEPDPDQFALLTDNLRRNSVDGIEAANVALGSRDEVMSFATSKAHGGRVSTGIHDATILVPVRRLSPWLADGADLVKLNIEGSEGEVFDEIEPQIRRIRNIVFEYHHTPGRPATLHNILSILDRNGFEYGINDFDPLINPGLHPTLMTTPFSKYYLLVFATRIDS